MKFTQKNLHKEFKTITNKTTTLMFISIFSTILMMNMSSMFPYIFPSSSQIALTLSMALPPNIIAGHLLLTLIGCTGTCSSTKIIPMIMIAQLMLMTLEFAVGIIQSYVFSILSTLYSSET